MQTITYLAGVIISTLIIGGIFGKPVGKNLCPSGEPMVACFVDPCSISTCSGDENATCVSNYCGECSALWFGADGNPADCDNVSPCPPDQPEVQCFRNPCQGATCSAYPNATCIPNYCGGCNAEWFTTDGEQVQCDITS
ncbi:unnamed protein product [Rotaria sp. Silwood2]|nr:unnamed protein product [Rotaria sp. Silwood2]CAF3029355.1 unnamed protein product [Rotaria sp. Silwood2]CAF4283531.1 unnamed protein product [Rotaria sp. Silwood2]CAF4394939.1 unnamed protein product [Rotaria sp. Silwood2]